MSPEQLALTVGRLQPLVAELLRAGRDLEPEVIVDEAAAAAGAAAAPQDHALVMQMLDHACRPEDPVPGEFLQLYREALGGEDLGAARVQMALFGAVMIATWRARPAGDPADV